MARQLTDNQGFSPQGSQVSDPWAQYAVPTQSVYTEDDYDQWAQYANPVEPVGPVGQVKSDDTPQYFDPTDFLKDDTRIREQANLGGYPYSGAAGVELLDIYRMEQGFSPLTDNRLENVYETQARMTSGANRESLFRDITTAPGGKLADFGADIVGVRFPEVARKMRSRNEAYYGASHSKVAISIV